MLTERHARHLSTALGLSFESLTKMCHYDLSAREKVVLRFHDFIYWQFRRRTLLARTLLPLAAENSPRPSVDCRARLHLHARSRRRSFSPARTSAIRINRIDQSQRLLVRQERLLHLVHDVGERDSVLRIGEGMAAARARMAKGERRRPEDSPRASAADLS